MLIYNYFMRIVYQYCCYCYCFCFEFQQHDCVDDNGGSDLFLYDYFIIFIIIIISSISRMCTYVYVLEYLYECGCMQVYVILVTVVCISVQVFPSPRLIGVFGLLGKRRVNKELTPAALLLCTEQLVKFHCKACLCLCSCSLFVGLFVLVFVAPVYFCCYFARSLLVQSYMYIVLNFETF